MYGKEGSKVYIDWGDGSSIQTIQISNGEEIHHTYSQAVKHFLSATGDLDSVVSFGMFEQIAIVDTISITSLSGLQDFTLGTFAEYQGHGIDFSHNPKLKSLSLHLSVLSIDHLDISHNPLLTSLSLEGLFLSTPALDNVIDNLSSNAVRLNTRNGFINIGDGFGGTGIIGPPSERSMRELYALINDYGWSVYPINYH